MCVLLLFLKFIFLKIRPPEFVYVTVVNTFKSYSVILIVFFF